MAKGRKIEGGLKGLKQLKPKNTNHKKYHKTKNEKEQRKYEITDSFYIDKTKVPKDTRKLLKDFRIKEFDNFYLKLNKFARFEKDNKPYFFKTEKGKIVFFIYPSFGDFDFKKNIEKQEKIVNKLFGKNHYKSIFKTASRLLIGSEESIYETSIRLHHIYGIPYIPATAIKGVVRSYRIQEKYNNNESEALKDNEFKKWFGSQEQEGKIVFFDAFPISKPKIKVDVLTPHYKNYYEGKQAPTDTQNPVPINFLTVEDTEFQFLIGFKDEVDNEFIDLFKKALTTHGIGAKTSVGYGYFK